MWYVSVPCVCPVCVCVCPECVCALCVCECVVCFWHLQKSSARQCRHVSEVVCACVCVFCVCVQMSTLQLRLFCNRLAPSSSLFPIVIACCDVRSAQWRHKRSSSCPSWEEQYTPSPPPPDSPRHPSAYLYQLPWVIAVTLSALAGQHGAEWTQPTA